MQHHRYPEEVKEDHIRRTTALAHKRPAMPWPECSDPRKCPVYHIWGESECRVQCWSKFSPTGQVGAARMKANAPWTGYIGE